MSLSDKHPEVIYMIVSINLHIGNNMDKGHYVCVVLDYNTGTWWNCDDDTINKYSGYTLNIYNDLSIDKEKKEKKCVWMIHIGLCSCYIFKTTFLHRALTVLLHECQYGKRWNILRIE